MRFYERIMYMLSAGIMCGELGYLAYDDSKTSKTIEKDVTAPTSVSRRLLSEADFDCTKDEQDDANDKTRMLKCSSM